MAVITEPFGLTQAGKEIKLFTITNNKGSILRVTNMGAVWVGMVVRDKNGNMKDVVLGLKSGDRYETASYDAFGGTVIFTADLICIISDCGIMRRQKANLEAVLHSRLSALTKIRECPERLT